MQNIEDFLPPKPDAVFTVAKGSLCDVADGVLDMIKTPIKTAESVTERMRRLAP